MKSPYILIVDDETDYLQTMKKRIKKRGYDVECASNGESALEIIKERIPDVIISDVKMPGIDGIQMLREVKKYCSRIEVILLTGHASLEVARDGMESGASEYLMKPVDMDELDFHIKDVLKKRDSQDKRKSIKNIESNNISSNQNISFTLSEFGKLISSVIHDMKNNNGMINEITKEMLEELQSNDDNIDKSLLIDLMQEVIKRNKMDIQNINKLKNIVIPEAIPQNKIDINKIIEDVVSLISNRKVHIEMNLQKDIPSIIGDSESISQVIGNLIQNAIQSMYPDGGKLFIETKKENDLIVINIADTGCGISEENQKRIFDLSFSTKRNSYGLGLYLANDIISRYKGIITFESEVNKGTTFTVKFPIALKGVDNE